MNVFNNPFCTLSLFSVFNWKLMMGKQSVISSKAIQFREVRHNIFLSHVCVNGEANLDLFSG